VKKVLVIGALLAVMLLTAGLRADDRSAATLAAIGFIVLTAYTVAEIGKSLSLPQVTGYIVAGVVLGPSAARILSGDVVAEMRMFNTLALGLIATSAGLELDARQIARLGRTLLLTTGIKVVLGVPLVTLTMLAVEAALGSLAVGSHQELVAAAIVMGVLSVGTSPSVTLAVLSETRARGRLSELVLGAAVFKDLVVVIGLAIAVAVARSLIAPAAALDIGLLGAVARELGGSILAGAVVGGILIAYIHFVGAEMLLFVAAMILVVAEVSRALHLELLLVFITVGFTVRNFSKL
jgi:Kef-type K+ transport system membrane component KefB